MPTNTIQVEGLTNAEFFERHAAPGRVALVAGVSLIDRALAHAQHLSVPDQPHGGWTHAFLLQGRRLDGSHWVIESDLQLHRRHIQLGVQENRIAKYHNDAEYPAVAVLDFGLDEPAMAQVFGEALSLVADHTRYSIRELFGTLLALRKPELRGQANVLARERSIFCSAFVQHCFRKAGADLLPGVETKNTTPEDLAHSPVCQTRWLLQREVSESRLREALTKVKAVARVVRRKRRALVARAGFGKRPEQPS